ncbi:hypothetical protein [Vibrio barjaei]|uniref:hypothetical protein n=1 Tax=Vibrio barjaei TaxID=1676683 RepID=UPI002283F128|nr:hypothetical protein [Vibrio barjaei]MCY9874013.1 hypothetical protein [Vibrio barjaei]
MSFSAWAMVKEIKLSEYDAAIERRLLEYAAVNAFYQAPPVPDGAVDDATLLGVDVNENGVRDALEILAYRTVLYMGHIEEREFDDLLSYVSYLQPRAEPIFESELSCRYLMITPEVRSELNLVELKELALDTEVRQRRFEELYKPRDGDNDDC